MKTAKVAIAIFLLSLLAGSSPVFGASSHQNVTLTLSGGVLDSGIQTYSEGGGQLVAAFVNGVPIDPSTADLHFSLHAVVSGFNVQGHASFEMEYSSSDGTKVKIDGSAPINDMTPAALFPLACTPGLDCTSGIPALFNGTAAVTMQTCQGDSQSQGEGDQSQQGGDNSNNCQTATFNPPMGFESAYVNPFGGPIIIASDDKSLVIIATYDHARVTWDGIQMGGAVVGQLSGALVTGMFAQTVSATEDLVAGTESERGTITFFGMTDASLNATGRFHGESTIPAGFDCSAVTGFPGTCQVTGLHSDGTFSMKNGFGDKIKGEYSADWTMPAVAFTSSVTATLN